MLYFFQIAFNFYVKTKINFDSLTLIEINYLKIYQFSNLPSFTKGD